MSRPKKQKDREHIFDIYIFHLGLLGLLKESRCNLAGHAALLDEMRKMQKTF
jgi:hypothetical protein